MQIKINEVEVINTSTGKTFKKVTIEDGQELSCWPDYSKYAEVLPGAMVEGVINVKGKYKNLVDGNLGAVPAWRKPTGVAAAQEKKAEYIKEAQERKDESIAWFNATNSAIALIVGLKKPYENEFQLQQEIIHWRNWFLNEWINKKIDF